METREEMVNFLVDRYNEESELRSVFSIKDIENFDLTTLIGVCQLEQNTINKSLFKTQSYLILKSILNKQNVITKEDQINLQRMYEKNFQELKNFVGISQNLKVDLIRPHNIAEQSWFKEILSNCEQDKKYKINLSISDNNDVNLVALLSLANYFVWKIHKANPQTTRTDKIKYFNFVDFIMNVGIYQKTTQDLIKELARPEILLVEGVKFNILDDEQKYFYNNLLNTRAAQNKKIIYTQV